MTKIRIIDVANYANVSKSTVSQYLNGRFGHMSEKTKEKIKNAISELNYVPNPIARSLKSDKTKTIGVIVRDISGFNTSRILRGIDDYCKQQGYNVLIYNTDFDEKIEKQSLIALKQMCVDGIIITSTGKNNELLNEYMASGFPVVQFQLEYQDTQSPIVVSDYQESARKATEYLISLGHQRIGFITQDFESSLSRQQRFQGYQQALEANQIPLDDKLIVYWQRSRGFAVNDMKTWLQGEEAPTAIFTQHLAITSEILKLFDRYQIEIPTDISLVGFDEIPMVDLLKVPVTAVQQNSYQIGCESAKLLLANIHDEKPKVEKVVVPSEWVIRQSCSRLE
ncbi:LacI family DNA-binding transcriptional regulator [Vibrio aphrogenes]|uniref:LacI family DNA-binding transcriptional regulator n=1 Tax=Vibrio aphrogenes TaxID=1891186 RepID=UPI000B3616FA|nr:LacI family DNA-binding transcriptional regulator [Vibrio aphrogenes]